MGRIVSRHLAPSGPGHPLGDGGEDPVAKFLHPMESGASSNSYALLQ